MANNELITAINILSDNVTLNKPSESICIDTEYNRIGILTDKPQFQLDITGNPTNKEKNGIGTPQIILTSEQGITTNNNLPLIIEANTVIKETLDVCNNAIFFKNISGQSITTIELSSNNIYSDNFYAKNSSIISFNNEISFNNNISFVNSAIIYSDVSVNGDICCNILRASNLSIQEISGDISFIGNFDFSGKVIIDGSLNATDISAASIITLTGISTTSDDRLKHNEKNITNGLEIIRQLEPQIYQKTRNFKHPDFSGIVNEAFILEAGLIAQEVEQINDLSFSVNIGNEIIPYSLNYNNIFVFGLAAIKELDKKISIKEKISSNLNFNNIENLVKSQNLLIQTLNQKISNLENRISNLEK
jgi:hypothetical protein